jgi:hypothetical protein
VHACDLTCHYCSVGESLDVPPLLYGGAITIRVVDADSVWCACECVVQLREDDADDDDNDAAAAAAAELEFEGSSRARSQEGARALADTVPNSDDGDAWLGGSLRSSSSSVAGHASPMPLSGRRCACSSTRVDRTQLVWLTGVRRWRCQRRLSPRQHSRRV